LIRRTGSRLPAMEFCGKDCKGEGHVTQGGSQGKANVKGREAIPTGVGLIAQKGKNQSLPDGGGERENNKGGKRA